MTFSKSILAFIIGLSIHFASFAVDTKSYEFGNGSDAQVDLEKELGITITERFGEQMDLNIPVVNELGEKKTLGDYFNQGRPVVLNLVYYNCPSTCNVLIRGNFLAMADCDYTAGTDYEEVFVSFEPKEGHDLAASKKANYIEEFKISDAEAKGIHFLTTEGNAGAQIAKGLGFGYKWDDKKEMYIHASVSHFLTEKAIISRYLHGLSYPGADYKLAITEAGEGKVGSFMERMISFCYSYDPKTGYIKNSMRIMSIGGGLTLLFILVFLAILWKGEFKKNNQQQQNG